MFGDRTQGERARITVPDIVWTLATLAFMGALYPVVTAGMEKNATQIPTGASYLLQLILPLAILVLLWIVWRKALVGGAT